MVKKGFKTKGNKKGIIGIKKYEKGCGVGKWGK